MSFYLKFYNKFKKSQHLWNLKLFKNQRPETQCESCVIISYRYLKQQQRKLVHIITFLMRATQSGLFQTISSFVISSALTCLRSIRDTWEFLLARHAHTTTSCDIKVLNFLNSRLRNQKSHFSSTLQFSSSSIAPLFCLIELVLMSKIVLANAEQRREEGRKIIINFCN